MRRLAILPLAVILIAWPARGDDPKADDKAAQGTWELTEAELGGMKLTLKDVVLTLEDGKYTLKAESLDKGTYTLNAAKKPKEVDIKGTDGPNKGKTILGIYQLDGDTMKVCYDLSGKGARPTEFKTAAGTQLFLATYKRKKS